MSGPIWRRSCARRLDSLDDLGSLFGAAPATGHGETASAGQKVEAARRDATQRLLPDATLQSRPRPRHGRQGQLPRRRRERPQPAAAQGQPGPDPGQGRADHGSAGLHLRAAI
ncbi:hypothetical protein ACRAWD_13300 [Caulobacter segnis]